MITDIPLSDRVQRWQELEGTRRALTDRMSRVAAPLEARAAARSGGYAKIVRVDEDGRLRFTVRGLGERTFSLEELEA